jgi:hypothetical protein
MHFDINTPPRDPLCGSSRAASRALPPPTRRRPPLAIPHLGTTSPPIPPQPVNRRLIYANFYVARWIFLLSVRCDPHVSQFNMDLPMKTVPPSTSSSKFNDDEAYLPIHEAYHVFSSRRPGSIPLSGCNIVLCYNSEPFRFI